tara:strand:+ start:1308 stop:1538 length:231 start_codon:yes stop_codon:yes gene_type:complete
MILFNKNNNYYNFRLYLLYPSIQRYKRNKFGTKGFSISAITGIEFLTTELRDFIHFKISILGFGFEFSLECFDEQR